MAEQIRTFEQAVALAKETVWGTGVAPTATIPVTGGGGRAVIEEIFDSGRRGVAAADFDAYQGTGNGEFSMEGMAYPVEIGHLIMGIMGADAITGASDPYTHTFSLAAIPPSYTLEDQVKSGANGAMRHTGSRISSLAFSFNAGSGVLTYTSSWQTKLPTKVTAVNPAVAVLDAWAGWRMALTSASLSARIVSGELSFTRESQIVHTGAATQNPGYINMGPLRVDGSITLAAEDITDFDRYLTGLRQSAAIAFSYGSPVRSLTFTMTDCDFQRDPMEFDRGGTAVFTRLMLRGIYNSTDVGPASVVLLGPRATAY